MPADDEHDLLAEQDARPPSIIGGRSRTDGAAPLATVGAAPRHGHGRVRDRDVALSTAKGTSARRGACGGVHFVTTVPAPDLVDRPVSFAYDYRMRCGCGGVEDLSAVDYEAEINEAHMPCSHCGGSEPFSATV